VGWSYRVRCPIGARQPTPEREKAGRRKEMVMNAFKNNVRIWVAYAPPVDPICPCVFLYSLLFSDEALNLSAQGQAWEWSSKVRGAIGARHSCPKGLGFG
jgi:hypothetical protein